MTVEQFKSLSIGDTVKVSAWEQIETIAPLGLRRYCGEQFRVHAINREKNTLLLEYRNGQVINRLFTVEMVEAVDNGFLCYAPIGKRERCGQIGKPTKMTDCDGIPLFVGDVVNIKRKMPKEVSNLVKGLEMLVAAAAKAAGQDITDKIGKVEQTFTAAIIENNDVGAFVCGLKDEYNDELMNTDDWIVKKIVDHSAVFNGAIIEEIKYCRE